MIDKSIPYYNIIMKYDGPKIYQEPCPPYGFSYCSFKSGYEFRWAQMEVDNNDFDTFENALLYFRTKYLSNYNLLMERFIGIKDANDYLCGIVICWDDEKNGFVVPTVHWLISDPSYQGKGIGTSLMQMLLYKFFSFNGNPIYLHTQPWSYLAIKIYNKVGFKLLKFDTFKQYKNESLIGVEVLKKYLDEDVVSNILNNAVD